MAFDASFNAQQWAHDHETLDRTRFASLEAKVSSIFKVLGTGGVMLLGILGWSIKTQYESMHAAQANAEAQLQAIQQVQHQVAATPAIPNRPY